MFPKTNRAGFKLSLFLMVLVLLPVRAVLADPRVRIDLERETHKKVNHCISILLIQNAETKTWTLFSEKLYRYIVYAHTDPRRTKYVFYNRA